MISQAVPGGILLPQSILEAPWFGAFAIAVAFNTMVYLGLTFSKLIPWPAQIHPSRVRALLPEFMWKERSMTQIRRQAQTLPEDPFQVLRSESVTLNVPRGLALTGALLVLIALINSAVASGQDGGFRVAALVYGLLMIALAMVLDRSRAHPLTMTWTWAVTMTILVGTLCWDAVVLDSPVSLTYAIIALTITPAISLSWPVALSAAVTQFLIIGVCAYLVSAVNTALWAVASFAALTAGFVLLHLRLNVIDNLSLEQMRSNRLQTTDPLTDCLSRPGMLVIAPPILAAAEQASATVYVAVVDIRQMQSCNATYGNEYGDRVLQAAARALAACLPDAAIARWDGDAFAALGIGTAPEPIELENRVDQALERSGVWLGKTPVTVHVGVACGPPGTDAIGRLADLATIRLQGPHSPPTDDN